MALSPKCLKRAAEASKGKPLTKERADQLAAGLDKAARELARRDAQRWRSLSNQERMAEAAQLAIDELDKSARLKKFRAIRQAVASADTMRRIRANQELLKISPTRAYNNDLVHTDIRAGAIRDKAITDLRDAFAAFESRDGVGVMRNLAMRVFDVANPDMARDVAREIYKLADGHTGNQAAKAAAKSWLDVASSLRERANSLGADIGELWYGYLSQLHDSEAVWKAGAAKWVDFILERDLLDSKQYFNADGTTMTPAQLREMLTAAHETIASEGLNKRKPGEFAGTLKANKGSQHRVLHFKDGDAWVAYMSEYGRGSLYDAMMGHIGQMSRDIAMMEQMGPNPVQLHKAVLDQLERETQRTGFIEKRSVGGLPDNYFRILSGESGVAESQTFAKIGREVRSMEVASKLGATAFTAFGGDIGTAMMTAHYHKLPYMRMLKDIGKAGVSKQTREMLRAHGVISETMARGLERFAGEHIQNSFFGHAAHATVKLSLLQAITDTVRDGASLTFMSGLAKTGRVKWNNLDEYDRFVYQRAGITDQEWAVINKAKPTKDFGGEHLTPETVLAIPDADLVEFVAGATVKPGAEIPADVRAQIDSVRTRASELLSGFIKDESFFASVQPDMHTRAVTTAGGVLKPGTVAGETGRSVALFHSFPIAMITRHLSRILQTPQGLEGAPVGFAAKTEYGSVANKVGVLAGFTTMLSLLSAITFQLQQLVQGKDPVNMDPGNEDGRKFWLKSSLRGGGLSYLGELLGKDPRERRSFGAGGGFGAFGPVFGSAGDLVFGLGYENLVEALAGEETKIAGESLQFAARHLPFVNIWQIKPMWERWALHQAQEAASPGYLNRMEERTRRAWGQEYFWAPGEFAPHRGPDFEAAFEDRI